ncbi:MAG: SOS response-associated peptidase family protein [Gammaproteobacteria bacterium]
MEGRRRPQDTPSHPQRDGDVFALAGLWDRLEGEGESLENCSIFVMPANEVIKPLHERMPAIIAPAHQDLWL